MARVYHTADAVNENYLVKKIGDVWKKALYLENGPLWKLCFAQRRINVLKQGPTVLQCSSDPFQHQQGCYSNLNQLELFHSTTLKDLKEFTLSTFSKKDSLKEESITCLWNQISNTAAVSIDEPDRAQIIAH